MGNRLYVGNLSYRTTTEELKAEFEQCGKVVDARVVTDRETNQNRGFGFVQFATDAEANEAIRTLDGCEFGGRQMRVKLADPRPAPSSGGQGPRPSSSGGQGPRPSKTQGYQQSAPPQDLSNDRGRKGGGRRRSRNRDEDSDWG